MDNYNPDFIIIGGGIAGLAAANRLADLGADALLIEAAEYPSHKVCGEFLSPECHHILEEWNLLPPTKIYDVTFITKERSFHYPLPQAARAQSRFCLDTALAQRAQQKGTKIYTNTLATHISHSKGLYEIELASGKQVRAPNLLIGTGRVLNKSSQPATYIGIKAHFEGIDVGNTLEMHLLGNAYAGISPIGKGKTNFSCLLKSSLAQGHKDPEYIMQQLLSHPNSYNLKKRLSTGKRIFPKWMYVTVPNFGIKTVPKWENAYFIGDAAGITAPASGDGLAIALTSGYLAADYAIEGRAEGFRRAWKKRYRRQLRWSLFLHEVLLRPRIAGLGYRLFPKLPDALFHYTRC